MKAGQGCRSSATANRPARLTVRVLGDETAALVTAFIGRHQCTLIHMPRHNGKVERYQRIMADGCLYARTYVSEDERRNAIRI